MPSRPRRGDVGYDTLEVAVQIGRVQIILWLLAGSLVSLNFLASLTGGLHLLPYSVNRLFDGNERASFLSGTKTTLLLLATVLMAGCAAAARRSGDPVFRGWKLLAVVSAFGFGDEMISFHQSIAAIVRDRYHFEGLLRYTWSALYLPVALAVLMVLVRDVRRLPAAVRRRLLPGGALYVIGVIALEPLKEILAEDHGDGSLSFKVLTAVADSTALLGLTLVVSAVLLAAIRLVDGFTVVLTTSEPLRHVVAAPPADGDGADPAWPQVEGPRRRAPGASRRLGS